MATQEQEEEWKRLCQLVAEEVDPEKLTALVEQLIGALDIRKQALERPDEERQPVRGGINDN